MSGIIHRHRWRLGLSVGPGSGPSAPQRGSLQEWGVRGGWSAARQVGEGPGPGGNDVRRECPPAMARPACSVGEAHHLRERALLMPWPRGGRTDNGWRTGDELCHQTRGLKDGPLECYQSCLDQDVRLSRSSVFSLRLFLLLLPRPLTLPALLPPSPSLPSSSSPFAASPASSPPLPWLI